VGELVWAACVSHAGGQVRVQRSETEQDKMDRVYAGWEELRTSLAQASPDALVVVGNDHMLTLSLDWMPIFALGRGDGFETWGEFGNTIRRVPGAADLADGVHGGLVADGFDVAGMVGMRLDHSYACPLAFLSPDGELPIVPLSVNTFVRPLPSFARCRALGQSLRRAIDDQTVAPRVALLATGGISHWIGVPETGRINPEWDQRFLTMFEQPDLEALDAIDEHAFVAGGGPGAGELLCWMAVLGAAGSAGARRIVYEPVEAWITGTSLVEVTVA
jgi:aromatic ring-opening dioxygenase catalytic subunit (LigB family)